jgi:hypothetical protein
VALTDQMGQRPAAGPHAALPRGAAAAPFLTRPYLNQHAVTSVFDHCNPNYTTDGRICEFEGIVAVKGNGVDPSFSRGYAITPGGRDYLYYDGHNGWDYSLWYENLLAAADGVVTTAGNDPGGFGHNITIDHGNGFTTRYAHMSSFAVGVGQRVIRGQTIGVSGNSGSSTGPHLHFGLYINNPWTAIDPYGWIGAGPDPWPADQGNLWIGGTPQNPGPPAPTGVTATLAGQAATVSWTAPAVGGPMTRYTITSIPDGYSATVTGSATSGTVTWLGYSTAYRFTVTATNSLGQGAPSIPSNPVTTAPLKTAIHTLDGWGGIHPAESTAALNTTAYWFGWDIARSVAMKPDGSGGYVLDGWGGLHSFGAAAVVGDTTHDYWPGWDIARDVAVLPDGSGGYILDGWGGLHPFAASGGVMPPAPRVSAYWAGWDIAHKLVLFRDGSGGYVLDGWGGIHPFATGTKPMPDDVQISAYWYGWDIARGITLVPDAPRAGYVLDGWGGLHPFAAPGAALPRETPGAYWPGWDIAGTVVASPSSSAGNPAGWVLDGYGGIHPYGAAGTPKGAYWPGWRIARGIAAG